MALESEPESAPVPEIDPPPMTGGQIVWRVINVLAALATLIVLLAAIYFIPEVMGARDTRMRLWQGAGAIALIAAFTAILRKVNWSLLYLALACAFFFSSCVANFHWRG